MATKSRSRSVSRVLARPMVDLELIGRTAFFVGMSPGKWVGVAEVCETPEAARCFASGFNSAMNDVSEGIAFAGVDLLVEVLRDHLDAEAKGGAN